MLIVAALPDPVGADRGHELVALINTSASNVDLTGWGLVDTTGGSMNLTGTIAAGAVLQTPVNGGVHLGNQGDAVVLVDPSGMAIDQVTYKSDDVRSGRTICFGR